MPEYSSDLQNRIDNCRIHKWAENIGHPIEQYLDDRAVPDPFRAPIHEVLIIRGEYPVNMQVLEEQNFQEQALVTYERYGVPPQFVLGVHGVVLDAIIQWKHYMRDRN